MKIAFIGQKGIPAQSGGVERHVEDLATHLVANGHQVTAYVRPHYTPRSMREWRGVRLRHVVSVPTKHLDTITYAITATIDVLFRRFDVIHYHSIGPSSLLWLVALLRPRLPIIATFHSRCYLHQKWNIAARAFLRISEWLLCRYADRVLVPSKDLYAYVQKTYPRHAYKVRYVPNGVATKQVVAHADALAQWDLAPQSYYVMVSRLIPVKAVHRAIDAFRTSNTDKKLVIVGDTMHERAYGDYLRKLAAGDDRIVFTGQQTGDTLAQLFSHAYSFVHASEVEGLSIAVLEAMAYGLPVVASDIAANREALGDLGIYCASGDTTDLGAALERVPTKQSERERYAQKARARVQERYDWRHIVSDVSEVYRQAVIAQLRPVPAITH